MKRGISILLFAILFSGCMKHESLLDEGKGREEAEKNFPVKNIHPDQNWVMATARTLNVTVNEKTGKTYVIKVFNDNPFNTKSDVRLLAQKEVKDGQSATIRFDAPTILKRVYVMRQAGEDYVIRLSDMKNELFSVTFGEIESRSARAESVVPTIDISKYATFNEKAERITDGNKLKKLQNGAWYIDSKIECKGEMSLSSGAYLYIKDGGSLKVVGELKLENRDSFISILDDGKLVVTDELSLENKTAAFYNAGTVDIKKVDVEKGILINDNSFSVSDKFEIGEDSDSDSRPEVHNHCRLIITKTGEDSFKLDHASFYNTGYVEVAGEADWEESSVYLKGDAVFNVAGKLEIDEDTKLSAEGNTTLIIAGEVEFDDEGLDSVIGVINVCSTKIEHFPGNVNIVGTTITDTEECTVHSTLTPIPDIPSAVTTYGFEDTVDGTTDYDFNDVVLQVSTPVDNKITVTLVAAGATNPITVQYSLDAGETYEDLSFNGKSEVHAAFGKAVTEMINTNKSIDKPDSSFPSGEIRDVPNDFLLTPDFRIRIWVNGKTTIDSYTKKQGVPYALSVPIAWEYPTERVRIDRVYTGFGPWGENMTNEDWYMPQSK